MINISEDHTILDDFNNGLKLLSIILFFCVIYSIIVFIYFDLAETQQHKLIHNNYWNLHPNYNHSQLIITIRDQNIYNSIEKSTHEIKIYRYIGNNT